MQNADEQIRQLEQRIAALEVRLGKLTDKQQRDVKALMGLDDVLDKHRKGIDADLTDAFDRIKNIEFTLFPNLIRDMRQLYRVIGDHEAKAFDPLDFRDPSKK